jgi:hypothetical protein
MPRILAFKVSEKGGASLDDREARIRCPKCKWRPQRTSRWGCTCGHEWNTFETHGVCPACAFAWRDTACHRCNQWSPHADWYAKD